MIKLIIFDLDGVLVDARELHYKALNKALESIDPKYIIQRDEHLSTYDGLPTSKKLNMLTKFKGLPKDLYEKVWVGKQAMTRKIIDEQMFYDERMRGILKRIVDDGYRICVASNSIRESVKMMLIRKGFMEYIDFFYSNQDVINPKPNVEMYLRCMIRAGVSPKECVIVEDSHIGRKAALDSGAFLCAVTDAEDVSYDKIINIVATANDETITRPKWQGNKMNVLIPMAGAGSRFQQAGYTFPKPLIDVHGRPMIQVVVDNLNIDARHIFLVQSEHYQKYNLEHVLKLIAPNCKIGQVKELTEGAACTALLAKRFIDCDQPLLIANSDQFMEWDSNNFMYSMVADGVDGGILTFESTHPKWSYAKVNDNGFVSEVAEKKPISNLATVGVYYWAKGSDFVKYAEQMIEKNIRTNGEFYICPVFNEAIADGKKIKTYNIDKMFGLGTPEDLKYFTETHK